MIRDIMEHMGYYGEMLFTFTSDMPMCCTRQWRVILAFRRLLQWTEETHWCSVLWCRGVQQDDATRHWGWLSATNTLVPVRGMVTSDQQVSQRMEGVTLCTLPVRHRKPASHIQRCPESIFRSKAFLESSSHGAVPGRFGGGLPVTSRMP